MGIEALISKRAELIDSAKKFLDDHGTEDGILSAEDAAEYDKMEAKIVSLGKEIERRQKLENIDSTAGNTLIRKPLVSAPSGNNGENEKHGRASAEYAKGFEAALRSNFREIENVLKEGVAEDGGYLVPDEYDTQITQALHDHNIMRQICRVIKTHGEHKMNIAGDVPEAAWIDEGEKIDPSSMKFSQVVLDAHKVAVSIPVTEELLNDAGYNVPQSVTDSIGKSIGNSEENKFLNGDGTKGPVGIFDATSGGIVAVTAESTGIKPDNIVDLIYSLKKPYRSNAVFVMHDKTVKAVRKLKDGDGRYMWADSLTAGEPPTLLSYKVYTSEYAPENKIAFGDFRYYVIGDRGTRSITRLGELGALEGLVYFVGKERVDGKLMLREAVQILTVAASVSAETSSAAPAKAAKKA